VVVVVEERSEAEARLPGRTVLDHLLLLRLLRAQQPHHPLQSKPGRSLPAPLMPRVEVCPFALHLIPSHFHTFTLTTFILNMLF